MQSDGRQLRRAAGVQGAGLPGGEQQRTPAEPGRQEDIAAALDRQKAAEKRRGGGTGELPASAPPFHLQVSGESTATPPQRR